MKFVPPVKWHNDTLLVLGGSSSWMPKHGDFVGGGGFTSADAMLGTAITPIAAVTTSAAKLSLHH